MANKALQTALDFTSDDLEANRDGRLSTAQIRRFRGMAITPGLVLLTGIVSALYGAALIYRENVGLLAVSLLFFGGIFGGAAYSRLLSVVRVLREPDITPLTGKLRKDQDDDSGAYQLHLDDETVIVPEAVYQALHAGRVYTLYYLPEVDRVLSAEST
jgi:hypothetical protein